MIYTEIKNVAIICTKDRFFELSKILENLNDQIEKFYRIIVIDSSESTSNISTINGYLNVDYFKTTPGLTHQRNIGVTKIPKDTNFCHFFDDDVILDDKYLHHFNSYIKDFSDIKIATGRQIDISSSNFLIQLARLTGINGKLLSNGINLSPNYHSYKDGSIIEWMPGCNMIIATELLTRSDIFFDEINRSGYSMGEDVDISIKLSRYGQIFYLPKCVYKHNLSTNNRASEIKKYLEFLNHRLLLTRDFPEKFKRNTFVVSVRLELILFSLLYFFSRKSYLKSWREAIRIFIRKIN